tara:strand:+ start:857 stop:1216 length:360 start_codon:yes stop_codon:yes gene_type:complete
MVKNSITLRYEIENFVLIALGAIPGALIRWQLNNDFLINIVGAGILGFIVGCKFGIRLKLLFGVGFCGALTTFSSWIIECLYFLVNGDLFNAIFLLSTFLFFALMSAFIGLWLGLQIKS